MTAPADGGVLDIMKRFADAWRHHHQSLALRADGRYREAELAATRAVAVLDGEVGPQAIQVVHNLAVLKEALGQVRVAEVLHRRAVETAAGTAEPALVRVRCGLSANLRLQGHIADARAVVETAVRSGEDNEGERWVALHELGNVATAEGRFSAAEATYEQALAAAGGEYVTGPATAGILQSYARLARARGDEGRAEEYIRRAIASRGPHATFSHPDDVGDPAVLGAVLTARGRMDEAEPLLRLSCATYELLAGPQSPHLLLAMEDLAKLLALTKRSEAAITVYSRVLDGQSAVFGPSHASLATTLHDLAVLLEATGQAEDAVALWERAATLLRDGARDDPAVDVREVAVSGATNRSDSPTG